MNEFTQTYLDVLRNFVHNNVACKIAENRQSRGMFEALERDTEWDADTDLSMGATGKLMRL
jgi:DNA-directed RNA polymerase III subunit RPC1